MYNKIAAQNVNPRPMNANTVDLNSTEDRRETTPKKASSLIITVGDRFSENQP
jgi:hypothetical protein